jgi:hypothetical protein
LCFYNVGAYNWGVKNPQITEEVYQEKIGNYRSFLANLKADVLGIGEFLPYMDEAHLHDANEVLYNYLYKESTLYVQTCLKSNYEILVALTGTLYSPTYSTQRSNYVLHIYNINGKAVVVILVGFTSDRSTEAILARKELFVEASNLVSSYNCDYNFIIGDFNTDGDDDTVDSIEEGQAFYQFAHNLGWETANNGYLGSIITVPESTTFGQYDLSCDNIAWLDNGKIVFNGFHAYEEEYENLSSDHYPITADFTLI